MAAGDKCNSFGMCSAVAPRIPRRTARSAADAVERTAEQHCVLDVLHVGANFLLPIACSDIARLCRRRDTYTSMGSTLSSLIHQVTWPKAIAVGVPLALGSVIGSLQAKATIEWYPTLDKPSWTPPAPLFGQAWSVFYCVMGYASYLVWKQGGLEVQKRPLTFYGLQLAFNLAWPITFFLRKKLGQGQIVNLTTLALASVTAREFYKVDAFAGKILIPYLAWLVFANALNYSIWKKNPAAGAPITARESLRDSPDKKNPGEEGYGSLQGRATASYSPSISRGTLARVARSAAVPSVLSQKYTRGQRLPQTACKALVAKKPCRAALGPSGHHVTAAARMSRATGRCFAL